jgi:uncharacterized repeat protein (TIGR02543 family)
MKKSRLALFLVALLTFILVFASACGQNSLSIPEGFDLDDSYKLTWTAVENARSYVVSVTGTNGVNKELTERRATINLADLAEGDYEIKVKAKGDGNNFEDSGWSQTISFHRDYECGAIYELINNDTEYRVAKVGTASGTVDLGDTYRGKPVTEIKEAAFRNSNLLENLTIGKYVTTIGDNAFYSCAKLKSVTIPESVTSIGKAAFQACYLLSSVTLPSGVTEISDNMFNYCRSLTSVTMHDITYIGSYAFADCTNLESITVPDTVTTLGEYAFAGDSLLKEIKLGKSLESIGDYAFYNDLVLQDVQFSDSGNLKEVGNYSFAACSSLQNIAFPEGLETIGSYTFLSSSALEQITLPDSLKEIGVYSFLYTKIYNDARAADEQYVYADNWLVTLVVPRSSNITEISETSFKDGVVGIANGVFSYCTSLERLVLPASVRIIGAYAFYGCDALWTFQTVDGNNLQTIGESAFRECTTLRIIKFSDGLKSIEKNAFFNCTVLDNNSLDGGSLVPDSVTHIGVQAFYGTKLWDAADDYGVIYAGNWVVGYSGMEDAVSSGSSSSNQSTVTLNSDVIGIADYAFYLDTDLHQLDGVVRAQYIGEGAFYGCSNLATINLNSDLRAIEDYTFYDCLALFSVNVRSKVTYIGRSAFYNCTQLSELDISGTRVQTIGDFAFYNNINLLSVDFSDYLTSIGRYSFFNCSSLTELSLPDTLVSVGDRAFYMCTELSSLSLGNGVQTIGDHAFANCEGLTKITITDSVKDIGNYAFYKCSNVKEVTLGNSVENIGNYAFAYIDSAQNLVIPKSVKSIGNFAFRNVDINTVVLSDSVKQIGEHAFFGCEDMTIYTNAQSILGEWNENWNSSYRPIIYGCTLSDDGSYVVSINFSVETSDNCNESNVVVAPARAGYTFLGWTTEEGTSTPQYAAEDLISITGNVTLYAIWQAN